MRGLALRSVGEVGGPIKVCFVERAPESTCNAASGNKGFIVELVLLTADEGQLRIPEPGCKISFINAVKNPPPDFS